MATSKEHYKHVLAPVYSWMYGGFAAALERNTAFFAERGLSPRSSGVAVDLGAGCGFQSIPLAQLGYHVTAIDLDNRLLQELTSHADGQCVETIEADLLSFREHVQEPIELAVCMTDTLLHLESAGEVQQLFSDVYAALVGGGQLIITFRDLTQELTGLDRFIPVRSDADTVFTCYLEYEPDKVKVHDLVYRRTADGWEFSKSYYRKLRVSPSWVSDELREAGFIDVQADSDKGSITVVATKSE